MIVLFTTREHRYTFRSAVQGKFGCPTPELRVIDYDELFASKSVVLPKATYVFGDLERLSPRALRRTASLYRSLTSAGLRCLNDPARVMSRVELLTTLHAAGINSFSVVRADENRSPSHFPVFIRDEAGHSTPADTLYANQAELDAGLAQLRDEGTPLRGMLIVEQATEKYADLFWGKWGTWRVGDEMIVEHLMLEEQWIVKRGYYLNLDDAAVADEHEAVTTNRFATELRPIFETAGIEFGRADHARVAGRAIIYEINTNPFMSVLELDPRPVRAETQLHGRQKFAEALAAIDSDATGSVNLDWR